MRAKGTSAATGPSDLVVLGPAELATNEAPWYEIEATARKLYAPKCNDAEWSLFLMEARALDLSPARREFIALSIGKEKAFNPETGREEWRNTYSGYVTIHGVRAIAQRSNQLDGTDGPYWCGPDGDMKPVWLDFTNPPVAARFTVFVKGTSRGFTGVCTMKRAKTYVKDNVRKLTPVWEDSPETMLAVRAEMDAYRRAGLLQDKEQFERGVLSLEGAIVEHEDDAARTKSGRQLHAIAASRGVDHEGARHAVQSVDPATQSLADAHRLDMNAAAEQLAVYDADGVARIAGVPVDTVTGEIYEAAPQPATVVGDDNNATLEQIRWIDKTSGHIPAGFFTDAEHELLAGAYLTADAADELITRMARYLASLDTTPNDQAVVAYDNMPVDGSDEAWTGFWQEARSLGFENAKAILDATKARQIPDTVGEARRLLMAAVDARG